MADIIFTLTALAYKSSQDTEIMAVFAKEE
jgi:hypothetical protein